MGRYEVPVACRQEGSVVFSDGRGQPFALRQQQSSTSLSSVGFAAPRAHHNPVIGAGPCAGAANAWAVLCWGGWKGRDGSLKRPTLERLADSRGGAKGGTKGGGFGQRGEVSCSIPCQAHRQPDLSSKGDFSI